MKKRNWKFSWISGKLKYDTALSILAYLKKEKEYVPLKAGLQNIAYISNMLAHTGGFGRFKVLET